VSFQIKTTWDDIAGFLDLSGLYLNMSYMQFKNHYIVWVDYENASIWTQLDKSDIKCADFLNNYAPKTTIKKTNLDDGTKHSTTQGIVAKKYARCFAYQGVTATITTPEYYFSVETLNADGEQVPTEQACCTMIRFEPNFDYDVMGGSFEIIDGMQHAEEIHISVVGNPEIPAEMGGSVQIITNEKYLNRIVSVDSKESMPLRYIEGMHTNVIVIHAKHPVGFQVPYQVKMVFYAKSI